MYDYSKLRGRIIEKFGSMQAFSDAVGTSNVTVSRKLNDVVGISREDIEAWSEKLEIKPEEYGSFYFTHKV